MKRILLFSLAYRPFVGGVEVAIKEITDRIDPKEIEFHVLTLRMDSTLPKEERIGNVFIHRIGFSSQGAPITDLTRFPLRINLYFYQLFAGFIGLALHKRYRFDGVWAMMAHTAGIPAGIFKTFQPNVPYLLTLQEGDPPEYIERLMRPVWPLFVRGFTKADKLQAISTFLLSWGKRMGFKGEGMVIPNAVDLEHFGRSVTEEEKETAREKFGKQKGEIWLVTTSRLVRKNAVDTVIQALPQLPAVTFVVAGIGPEEAALRNLAEEQGVTTRVKFLGTVDQEALPALLAVSDIFIRPSRSEGMGISFLEAMAARLPVIATQVGGISDFLFDATRNGDKPTTGFAVDVENPSQIVDVVKYIIANPDVVKKVTDTAYERVRSTYDWEHITRGMLEHFFVV